MFDISSRRIGTGYPTYIVAEISANHCQRLDDALTLVQVAKDIGADAVKLQTFTADTLTIQCNKPEFLIREELLWSGRTLYSLYKEAYMPWEWQPKLKEAADNLNLDLFSSPFDQTAVDFLESMNVPAYKIASFEIVDIPLIAYIAGTRKPIIISTGMATLSEIEDAIQTSRNSGATQIALLKCTSTYPAPPEAINLRTIPHLADATRLPVGISDHTLGIEVPVAAVALGACIVEKHFTLSRSRSTPDSMFSLEPREFKAMVETIRITEKALGKIQYGASAFESNSLGFRRSLYAVKDIKAGESFSDKNIRSIRPSNGLHPRYLNKIIGKTATLDIAEGTPLNWEMIG